MYNPDDSNLTTTARVEYEKTVTIDDVVKEANQIFAETRRRKLDFTDFESTDKYAAEMRRTHKQFADAYPVVLRYITQLGEYSEKALRLYLTKLRQNPWTTEDSYLRSQADYVVMLYKAKHRHWNATHVSNLRENVYTKLKEEKEKFKQYSEKFQKEVELDEEQYKLNRQRELAEFVAMHSDVASCDLTPKCQTDIPMGDLPDIDFETPANTADSDSAPSADSLLM